MRLEFSSGKLTATGPNLNPTIHLDCVDHYEEMGCDPGEYLIYVLTIQKSDREFWSDLILEP